MLYHSILAIFAEYGRETGEAEIRKFLPELSRKGSGDDVSIAGIVASSLSTQFVDVLKAQSEYSNAREQNEKAVRAVTLAAEKLDYVLSALQKAESNYDDCEKKRRKLTRLLKIRSVRGRKLRTALIWRKSSSTMRSLPTGIA